MARVKTLQRSILQHWMLTAWGVSIALAMSFILIRYFQVLPSPTEFGIDESVVDWKVKLARNLVDNVLALYMPIIAIMLTSFFSAKKEYRQEKILYSQAIAAITVFSFLQAVNLIIIGAFIFFSTSLLEGGIPAFQTATFAVVMGIIVTFSFPEEKESEPIV